MGSNTEDPIAIIGAACRLPGEVSSLGSLWDMINNVKTGHCKIPSDRWDADTWHHPDPDRKGGIAVKHGYFLQQDIGHFDAPFFSTTAKEAAAMDPMKRLLLEVSYESIENAGIPVENLMNSRTGCYVGCMTNDYEMLSLHDIHDIGHNAASATSEAMTANRVSWFFGLRGPSLTLDTACSSSLYALHLACQSLRTRETDSALVAGVNLILVPNTMHQLSAMHMLSPEGISHTFDDRANGYGRGEGIGSLVVKRLSDALRDGDTIRAIIRGTGANADGKTPSITQPSSLAQADLIRDTYAAAGLPLTATQYFECHGTGTPVGDPIELEALSSTLGAARTEAGLEPMYIGSIKPTVGHTEGCSGLAGVFKAIACLEHGMLVPTYGVGTINPKLKLQEWNLALPQEPTHWPSTGQRRISVNSFGFGGANAHAILDDAYHYLADRGLVGNHNTTVHEHDNGSDDSTDSGVSSMGPGTPLDPIPRLFLLSSKDQAGIPRLAESYSKALDKPDIDKKDIHYLGNLTYTLSSRRTHHDFRSFTIASTLTELVEKLGKGLPKLKRSARQDNNLIWVFTGQGAQWPAMGKELSGSAIFEDSVLKSQSYLEDLGCRWNAVEEMTKTGAESKMQLSEYSQTLCTVLQVALVDLLRSWGIKPRATVGHSSGEIGAAYSAGYLTHADAVKIAYVRGLSSTIVTRQGGMLAAGLSREEANNYLSKMPKDSAVVACVNSPSSVTLSGNLDTIQTLEKVISADGKFARALKVKTAYHSPHMRSVAQGYLEQIGHIKIVSRSTDQDPDAPVMYSSLTGKIVSPEELNAHYWVNNLTSPVEFSNALTSLLGHTVRSPTGRAVPVRWGGILEVGPHAALQGPVQQIIANSSSKAAKEAPYTSILLRGKDAMETALAAAGNLWALGHNFNLSAVVDAFSQDRPVAGHKALVDLPPYPWNHNRRFWHEAYTTKSNRFPKAPRTDYLGVPVDLQNSMEPRWRNHLRLTENPWIEDHKITGTILYPGAGMLVMALEGALQMSDSSRKVEGFRFRDVRFERGLVVPAADESPVETSLTLNPDKAVPGQFAFTIYTTAGDSWTRHCHGNIALEYTTVRRSEIEDAATSADASWAEHTKRYQYLSKGVTQELDVETFYDQLETIGMEYGPLFRNVTSLFAVPDEHAAHGAVEISDTASVMPFNFEYPHVMHPATMDSIFHLLLAGFNDGRPIDEAAVPYSIDDMFVAAEQPKGAGTKFLGYGQLTKKSGGGRELAGDLIISDENWSGPKMVIKGFALRQVTAAADSAGASGARNHEDNATKKCARVTYTQDIDFLKSGEDLAKLTPSGSSSVAQLSAWLDRLAHKKSVGEVLLVLDGEQFAGAAEIVNDAEKRIRFREGFQSITPVATSDKGVKVLRSLLPDSEESVELWDPTGDEKPPAPKEATGYDLVLVIGTDNNTSQLKISPEVLLPGSHIVVIGDADDSKTVEVLKSQGYTSPVVVSNDSDAFVIAATPAATKDTSNPSEVYIILPSPTSEQTLALLSNLTPVLQASGISVRPVVLSQVRALDFTNKHVISLLEAEKPFIYSWSDTEFTSFKTIVSTVSHLFWVTHGGAVQSWSGGVEFAAAQGLLRVLRNEYTLVSLPHLDLSNGFDLVAAENANLIADVWRASLVDGAEMEYAELQGQIHVPRAVADVGFDGDLQLVDGTKQPVLNSIHGDRPLKPTTAGSEIVWIEDEESALSLGPTEIEVQVEFVGLAAGKATSLSSPDTEEAAVIASSEAVGIVSRVGEAVNAFAVGQRVAILSSQSQACRTHVRQDESLVAPVPEGISPKEAAALPSAFVTALYALSHVARLEGGQAVLVHSAASALGQAAVQIAQYLRVDVFALVSSKEEKDMLVERYGLPSSRIFDATLQTFVSAISHATNGRGVDAVVVSDPGLAAVPSLATLSDFGFFIDLSNSETMISPPSNKKNISMVRIAMGSVAEAKPRLIKDLFQLTFKIIAKIRTFKPIFPTMELSVSNVARATEAVESQRYGKVVVSFESNPLVLTPPAPAPELQLDPEATYVIAGGLGALGLNITDMMIQRGARHLVFLSRSGGKKNQADLECIRSRQVRADSFACDVTDAASVAKAFSQLRRDSKRTVKGIIQCAMVLEDGIFDNMTHAKWNRAFAPKSAGSRNLLAQLWPDDKPFFILLSSITGVIGNTAQANYASGNTFEDALALFARTHLGIPATSIDVGLVADSSHFTEAGEFGDLEGYLHRYQHGWVGLRTTLDELRVALQAVMRGATADGKEIPAQVVLGLGDSLIRDENNMTGFQHDRKFELRVVQPDNSSAGEGGVKAASIGENLSNAASLGEATAAVEEYLKTQIAVAIGVEVAEVDAQKPLPEFGVDSLKAVEIRNKCLREMQSDISVFELLSSTPVADLAVKIATRSGLVKVAAEA
ncbi:putative polyketide synthase [Podospora fimiseda]|uniref:Polyketide synthase n=1 Tax=Podospora fimiseda TaxID=252190 RepID=A0AAN7BIT2_9PEZI|nr:putative polyketide synthase [Podospora fimiseda]